MSCEKKLTEDKAIIIKTMEATTPELGPVGFWSPKSSFFSGSDSIVVEEAAKNDIDFTQGELLPNEAHQNTT